MCAWILFWKGRQYCTSDSIPFFFFPSLSFIQFIFKKGMQCLSGTFKDSLCTKTNGRQSCTPPSALWRRHWQSRVRLWGFFGKDPACDPVHPCRPGHSGAGFRGMSRSLPGRRWQGWGPLFIQSRTGDHKGVGMSWVGRWRLSWTTLAQLLVSSEGWTWSWWTHRSGEAKYKRPPAGK